MRALLLIDIQNDFMPGGRLPVADGDAVVEPVNRLLADYPLVVASQDWHPAGHESFASVHPGRQPFDIVTLHGLEQVLWPDHCIAGSSGADSIPLWIPRPLLPYSARAWINTPTATAPFSTTVADTIPSWPPICVHTA